MRFTFLHAADLHIDSPLAALGRKSPEAARLFADAGRRAVSALIEETLASGAAFLLIAGDVFDGEWRDMGAGLFFVRELARLERAGVPVFLIRGNHDAASQVTRALAWPANVTEFSSRKAESRALEDLRVLVHGRSFPHRSVPEDFLQSYPPARPGWINIGVLHTSLAGRPGHDPYAPCTTDDLRRFGYDYWALGHIHAREIVSRDPWIVFPGNIQGRSVRETGPKGAERVTIEDGAIVAVEPVALDCARWAQARVDIAPCRTRQDVMEAIAGALREAHAGAQDRPLAVRLSLTGATPWHEWLTANGEQIEAEAEALAARVSADLWIESLRLATSAPRRPTTTDAAPDTLDVPSLLQEAAAAPAFAAALAGLTSEVRAKLPRDLHETFDAMIAGDDDGLAIGEEAQALLAGRLRQDVDP